MNLRLFHSFAVLLLISTGQAFGQIQYSVVNLEDFASFQTPQSGGRSINNLGQIAGNYFTPGYTQLRGFVYAPGTGMNDVPGLGGGVTYFNGINDHGQVAGFGGTASSSQFQAFRYTPGVGSMPLGNLGGANTEANGINVHGQVVGSSELSNGNDRAFRYSDGVGMQDLGSLFGGGSKAWAINSSGWVTGQSDGFNAFLYRDGVGMSYLGPGVGRAINEQGVVVGESPVGNGQATMYRDGQTFYLGDLGGGASGAFGINSLSQVVGNSLDGNNRSRPFLWTDQGSMVNLNDLIDPNSGWTLVDATAINDAGQIVGLGLFNGKQTAYLLNAVPEPTTWALLLLGAGTLFFFRRRKA